MLSPQMPKDTVEAKAAKSPSNPVGSVMPAMVNGAEPSPTITPLMLTLGFTPPCGFTTTSQRLKSTFL